MKTISSSGPSSSAGSKGDVLELRPHGEVLASVSSCPDATPKEKIIKAIVEVLTQEFREGLAYENRVIYEAEALILASLVIQKLNLS